MPKPVNRDTPLNLPHIPGLQECKTAPRIHHQGKDHATGLRILHFCENVDTHYSGGRYHHWGLAVGMAQAGHYCHILTNCIPPFISDFPMPDNMTVQVGSLNGTAISEGNFDLVVGDPVPGASLALAYSKQYEIPCMNMIFDPPNFMRAEENKGRTGIPVQAIDENKYINLGFWHAIKHSDYVLASTEVTKRFSMEWVERTDEENFFILNPPFNDSKILAVPPPAVIKDEITFVSRMVPHKGITELIRAISLMPHKMPLNLIGSVGGLPKWVTEEAKAQGVEIRFLPKIPDDQKFKIMSESALICIPSKFEGFGMVPGEALMLGKECVVLDIPTIRENYQEHVVYASRFKGPEDLSRALQEALAKSDGGRIPNEAGRKHVLDNFSMAAFVRKIADIVKFEPRFAIVGIAFNEEEFIEKFLKHYLAWPECKQIIIAEGRVKDFPMADDGNGSSTDRTPDIIKRFAAQDSRVKIVQRQGPWKDKLEMWKAAMDGIEADHKINWVLRGGMDEFTPHNVLNRITDGIRAQPSLELVHVPMIHYYGDTNHCLRADGGLGLNWETVHQRFVRWRTSFDAKHHASICNEDGRSMNLALYGGGMHGHIGQTREACQDLWDRGLVDKTKYLWIPDGFILHYGYARNQDYIKTKRQFYAKRDNAKLEIDGKIVPIEEAYA